MRCAFSSAGVIPGEVDFMWMTATISKTDQSDNYHSDNELMGSVFFQVDIKKCFKKGFRGGKIIKREEQ